MEEDEGFGCVELDSGSDVFGCGYAKEEMIFCGWFGCQETGRKFGILHYFSYDCKLFD